MRLGICIHTFICNSLAIHMNFHPSRSTSAGVVAAVTVSGLPQLDDHRMIIEALDQYLKIELPKF